MPVEYGLASYLYGMPKRSRAGAPIYRRKKYRTRGARKGRVGAFKKRVRAIARGVVRSQAEAKQYDQGTTVNLSSATVPSGGAVALGWLRLTTAPGQGTTGSTRVGSKIRAINSYIKYNVTNITSTANTASSKAVYLRVAVLEMRDQTDVGNIETIPGNACFEENNVNIDLQSYANNRMNGFWNKRLFNILSDKIYTIGSTANPDKQKSFQGSYNHKWGGQEWSFISTTLDNIQERRVYLVWAIDSQDGARGATAADEVQCRLAVVGRLNFYD